ncbi:hypothetical protein KFK09_001018 [Dendrobium nobile]|uniref:Uncharacterized protein n=1 Tax=Dendrobium nobile TaxID=94219 RepID=A0A8T3CGE7_DENNO|nr:hypothetical protein KFK09_001018 [Dendrobium nobile]
MSVDEPPQGSKKALSYSPSRSPASMRFYGVLAQKQRKPSSVSKRPPEPLRRAVADCLSSTVPNLHGNPSLFSSEAARILRDFLANPVTVDMAYNVLLEHALAERDRSPAVVPRCITFLKHYLLRYTPKAQMLRQIDRFCENCIFECESITKQRVSLWSMALSQNSRTASNPLPTFLPASSFALASLVKSLNYVRSLVQQQLPKLFIQPLGTSGPSTYGKQSLPSLSSFLTKSLTSHQNSEVVTSADSPQRNQSSLQSLLKVSNLDGFDAGSSDKYIYSDLLSWRFSGDREHQSPYLIRESPLKAHDLHTHGFIEVGAAALLIGSKEAKISEKSLKYPVSQNLPDVGQLLRPLSVTEATNFGSVDSHLKAIAASKRMKGGPQQVWEKVSTGTFHPRAHPLFQYRHYSEQQPLRLNSAEISEVIAEACSETSLTAVNLTISSPLAKHNARPVAEVAISVLIKLVIDMYVMDCASAAPLTLLMLEDMLTSQTVASRIRVFDLILNLGVHAHLLEPVVDDTPAIVEEDVREEPCLNNEEQGVEGNVNAEVSIQQKMSSAVENFEQWLLTILFEVLHLLVQTEEKEEIVWASALSSLFYFICDRGKILRSRLDGLDIRVIKVLLEISREHSWAEIVHKKLICMLTNMLYQSLDGTQDALIDTHTLLVEQLALLGGIDFICLEYSQAKSKEEKRNLFLVLFDYALHQINEARLISGASAYAFDEVQAVSSMLILADAPEAFYIVVKHGVDGIGQILMKSISGALSRSPNHGHLDLITEKIISELDDTLGTFTHLDNEFADMMQLTKSYQSSSALDELGEAEIGLRSRFSWATLHSLLHAERAAYRHHGYIWLVELLILEIGKVKGRSIWANIEIFKQHFIDAGNQDITSSAAPLSIIIMCGLLKSKHNFIRKGFLFVLERFLMHCKLRLDEDQLQSINHNDKIADQNQIRLQKAYAVIDVMSCALSLVVLINETDHLNILKMCDILFSQLCLRLPAANETQKGDSDFPRSLSKPGNIKIDRSSGSICSSQDFTFNHETESMAALVLRGHAIVPMQLVARVPPSLFDWPLIQLAGAVTDDIALGVAVGSEGRANLPGATSDIRAALLLLLIGKCSADSAAFREVDGEEFFRGLLEDPDSRVAYCSAAFLLKRMMTEEPENYQRLLQSLIIKAQQCNNEKLLENPYLQMRGILQLMNEPVG